MNSFDLDEAIDGVVAREGGFVDHENDRGGPTKYGIAWNFNKEVLQKMSYNENSMKDLSRKDALQIYKEKYFYEPKLYLLPDFLKELILDFGVNSGPRTAIRILQRQIGAEEDGILGPKTLEALKKYAQKRGELEVANEYLTLREEFVYAIIKNDRSQEVFLNGWLNRIEKLRRKVNNGKYI